jgi:hypothetical protein
MRVTDELQIANENDTLVLQLADNMLLMKTYCWSQYFPKSVPFAKAYLSELL